MEETITLSGGLLNFFVYYLTVKRPVYNKILSSNTGEKTILTDVLLKILAYLLYLDQQIKKENSDLSEEERWMLLNGKEYKTYMAEKLRFVDRSRINNYLSKMRKIGILDKNGINNKFKINPENVNVVYKIYLQNGKG